MIKMLCLLCVPMLVLCACRAEAPEEQAAAAEYVEGDTRVETQNGSEPQKVENSTITAEPETRTAESDGQSRSPAEQPANTSSAESTNTESEKSAEQKQAESGNTESRNTPVSNKKESGNLKLMTFNVRCANDPNGHSIDERAPRVRQKIVKHAPDLVGMQEVTPAWEEHLKSEYPEYTVLLHYRTHENKEGLAILYKTARFTMQEENFFWLSETPNQESKGWDAQYYRICTWARLKDKVTGKTLVYLNVHLDGTDKCHLCSAALVAKELERNKKYTCFLGGDFNMKVGSTGYYAFFEMMNEARTDVQNPTSPAYTRTYPQGYPEVYNQSQGDKYIYDYMFYQEDKAEILDYEVDQALIDDRYASDHYPVICTYHI